MTVKMLHTVILQGDETKISRAANTKQVKKRAKSTNQLFYQGILRLLLSRASPLHYVEYAHPNLYKLYKSY
jgi:hypothetical protein